MVIQESGKRPSRSRPNFLIHSLHRQADENSQALLQHNAKVYLAARNKSRADAAIADLKVATGREAIFLELDLASLASVRRAADDFMRYLKDSRCA